LKNIFVIMLLLLLSGCPGFNQQDVNGIFDTQPDDCSIFKGRAGYRGRVTESDVDGTVYVRRGKCTPQDDARAKS